MAIQSRCPGCESVIVHDDPFSCPCRCSHCDAAITLETTLCVVCDQVNPWRYRDSLHVWCTGCGHTQMIFSHLKSA